MKQASSKYLRNLTEKNKQSLHSEVFNKPKDSYLIDVLVLEVLEKNIKSEWIKDYVCKNGIELVVAFSVLHGFFYAFPLANESVDFIRANFGSNGNIIGREIQLEVKGNNEESLIKGKLVFNNTNANKQSKNDLHLDLPFSFGSFQSIFGSIEDSLFWKVKETEQDVGYVWQQIKSFDVKKIGEKDEQ